MTHSRISAAASLIAIVVIVTIVSGSADARRRVDESSRPLYLDAAGWQITTAALSCDAMNTYESVMAEGGIIAEYLDKIAPVYCRYIYDRGCSFFVACRIDLNSSARICWPTNSYVTMVYTVGRDTLQADSSEIFFVSSDLRQMQFIAEGAGDFCLPNSKYIFKSSAAIFFARFDIKKNLDSIVKIIPMRVYSISDRRR